MLSFWRNFHYWLHRKCSQWWKFDQNFISVSFSCYGLMLNTLSLKLIVTNNSRLLRRPRAVADWSAGWWSHFASLVAYSCCPFCIVVPETPPGQLEIHVCLYYILFVKVNTRNATRIRLLKNCSWYRNFLLWKIAHPQWDSNTRSPDCLYIYIYIYIYICVWLPIYVYAYIWLPNSGHSFVVHCY